MSEQEWEEWARGIADKLHQRSFMQDECRLWTGAFTQSYANATEYGIIRTKPPLAARRRAIRVHILAYVVTEVNSRKTMLGEKSVDISHICHNGLCVEERHLSPEPRTVNNLRRTCRRYGICQGHVGYPYCLLG